MNQSIVHFSIVHPEAAILLGKPRRRIFSLYIVHPEAAILKIVNPFPIDKIVTILKPYNFRILPLIEKSLSSVIRLGKDPTKKCDKTNVVYKFFCKSCPASYVGETKRTIKIRINEHQKNNNLESHITGRIFFTISIGITL